MQLKMVKMCIQWYQQYIDTILQCSMEFNLVYRHSIDTSNTSAPHGTCCRGRIAWRAAGAQWPLFRGRTDRQDNHAQA